MTRSLSLGDRDSIQMYPHLRVSRPVRDLRRTVGMYEEGLDLVRLDQFTDHEGFDGVMLGFEGADFQLEFTYCRTHPVSPAPTPEDLFVFYFPDRDQWASRCAEMLKAGFAEVKSFNPYWDSNARTFEDADGYRVALQCSTWGNSRQDGK